MPRLPVTPTLRPRSRTPTLPRLPVIPTMNPHRDPPARASPRLLCSATMTLEEEGAEGTEPKGWSRGLMPR